MACVPIYCKMSLSLSVRDQWEEDIDGEQGNNSSGNYDCIGSLIGSACFFGSAMRANEHERELDNGHSRDYGQCDGFDQELLQGIRDAERQVFGAGTVRFQHKRNPVDYARGRGNSVNHYSGYGASGSLSGSLYAECERVLRQDSRCHSVDQGHCAVGRERGQVPLPDHYCD